jgi:hypothetical protein
VSEDGSAVSRAVVVVNARPVLRDELAREHAEVRTRVVYEPAFASLVLSMMKRWLVAVVQACSAADVCCASLFYMLKVQCWEQCCARSP